ncbi:MAG: FCD domain-containing protein [Chloroflexota bacterium]
MAVERGNLDEAALAKLAGSLTATARAAQAGDALRMVAADMDFHTALSALSGHDLPIKHLAAIQVHSRRVLFYSNVYRPTPEIVVQRHRDLLEILHRGDAYEVSLAIDRHITGPNMDVLEKMVERERAGGGTLSEDA